jgi:hypothetical protein
MFLLPLKTWYKTNAVPQKILFTEIHGKIAKHFPFILHRSLVIVLKNHTPQVHHVIGDRKLSQDLTRERAY